jgi:hypothetical protein
MLDAHNPALRNEISHTWEGHHKNLPLWSDSAGGPHGCEGKPNEQPAPSKFYLAAVCNCSKAVRAAA